jgi:hypothetical protein
MLSDRSLGWLRHIDRSADADDDPVWSALSVALLARRTPAWTERYRRILDRLIERLGVLDPDPESGASLVLLGLRAGLDDGPDPVDSTHRELAAGLSRSLVSATVDDDAVGAALVGLGLRLHDTVNGTDLHRRAFAPWWNRVGLSLVDRGASADADSSTVLTLAVLLAPQVPDEARRLFDAARGRLDPARPDGRAELLAGLLAREWGLDAPARPEGGPTTDALAAAVDAVGPGRWTELFDVPVVDCPQVIGVEFPEVALDRAEWVRGSLHLHQSVTEEDPRRWTTFRLVGDEPRMWYLTGIDGASMDTAGSAIVVRVPRVGGELEFAPGSY